VVKPAEDACLSILRVAELAAEVGFPPGALNIVTGYGHEVGDALVKHRGIDHVSFTGSPAIGKVVVRAAAENHTPVTLELGGKSPNIFFEDVLAKQDSFLDKSLEGFGMFALNQGEVCTCPSRALIQKSIHGEFLERAIDRARKHGWRAGIQRSAREDPELPRHRQERRRQGVARR
jgi:acyl-CoA reductase-like NAD-dependent aldehyde dehydrogenase